MGGSGKTSERWEKSTTSLLDGGIRPVPKRKSHQLNFLSANYFPFTGSIIVSKNTHSEARLPFLGSKN